MYATAPAFTTAPDAKGKCAKTDAFPIKRGVLQGDIMSSLFFILALEYILRWHDNMQGKGVNLSSMPPTCVFTLGYADDAALLDEDIKVSTTRVTSISSGSRQDADMVISVEKTEVMHVQL